MNDLEKYRVFFEAARYENFTRAAKELFVTQSSISQSVKTLEKALGVQLFHAEESASFSQKKERCFRESSNKHLGEYAEQRRSLKR